MEVIELDNIVLESFYYISLIYFVYICKSMAKRPFVIEAMSTQPTFIEGRMQSLMFAPLNSDGSNFLKWVNDEKTVLSAND
jgi:hypothetical protein